MEVVFRRHEIRTARDDKIAEGNTLLGFSLDVVLYHKVRGALAHALEPGRLVSGKEMERLTAAARSAGLLGERLRVHPEVGWPTSAALALGSEGARVMQGLAAARSSSL